jgi:hypothetical protein
MNRADYLRRRYLMLTGQLPEQKQVGPESISAILAGMGGQEDRLGALVQADRVPAKDITTVIKKSEDPDTPTTETITIKGGLLGDMYDKFDPYGGIGTGGGMDDPNWSRATAVNTPPPTNLPGTDFFGGEPTAPQPTARELIAATQSEMEKAGWPDPQDHVAVGGVGSRLTKLLPRRAQAAAHRARMRNIGNYKAQQDMAKKAMIAGTIGAGGYAGMELAKRMPDQDFQTPRQQIQGVRPTGRFPQEVLDRERISVPPPGGRSGTLSPEVIEQARKRQQNTKSPFPNRFPEEVLDRRRGIQQTPFRGEGEDSSQVAMPPLKWTQFRGEGEAGSDVSMSGTTTEEGNKREMDANPKLEKIWGRYAYDPAARRKFYLDQLKDIWRKAMLMDVVANLTGGKSMSSRYIQMATGRLDATDKFNEEERISNIWKEVFSDAEGNFYMPKTKREAAERAAKTGAQPKLISSIFGSVPEAKKKDQYFRVNPNDKTKWEIIRPDEDPGKGWVRGTPTARAPLSDKDIYMERFEDWQELEKTNPELAKAYGRMIGAVEKDPKGVSPSRWTSILQGDIQGSDPTIQLPEGETATSFIMKWLTQPEVEYVDPISGDAKKMPGYSGLTGQTATEAEIAEATGATTATKATEGTQERLSARDRAQQLKAEGKTKEEAKEIMRKEGYDIG